MQKTWFKRGRVTKGKGEIEWGSNEMAWFYQQKTMWKKNEARAYINNVDVAILEYYRAFAKKIKPLPPELQLSDFYHPSDEQKNGELLLVAVGTDIATYALYKHLK